jgi:DNA-binding CsgD family transcriptional regulator
MNGQTSGIDSAIRLTNRELEVIRLVAGGCTYARTAERLGVSLHTVTTHIKNAYRKLDVHSAGAAVMRAVQLRMIGEGAES